MGGCRNDPALAAAELALAIEKAALGTGAGAADRTSAVAYCLQGCCARNRKQQRRCTSQRMAAGATETVATVGLWQQEPNIYNAIPRSVRAPVICWR